MDNMIAVQKKLEESLLILAEEGRSKEKQLRVYQECFSQITVDRIPRVMRKDYYSILTLLHDLHVGQESAHFQPLSPEKAYIRSVGTELPAAIILLYKHLTEWIAVENYLVSQRYFLN
ncbi:MULTISPECIES: hypothetical protein [Enterobacter]|uniref:hypothetical protein n=1 Tax=Enterobacter TaxID=547 RepID=UPI001260F5AE|nr:hypothetical protein [Enterobacter oligotrophicus]ELW1649056.1 hypothetical protein [Enterobacter oligotrophicus]MBT9426080.1 hypothetical protein [Enterobacter oligotrophicus]